MFIGLVFLYNIGGIPTEMNYFYESTFHVGNYISKYFTY